LFISFFFFLFLLLLFQLLFSFSSGSFVLIPLTSFAPR
jgi:hypothetical protein